MGDINEYFSRKEFGCRCGCGFESVDAELLTVLTRIRKHFNSPITITSGNRCKIHNTNQGGASGSKHTKGIAADFKVDAATPQQVVNLLNEWYPDRYGVGLYKTWTHLDVRSDKARWEG